jgi:thiamine biosynthesis protein ThiC
MKIFLAVLIAVSVISCGGSTINCVTTKESHENPYYYHYEQTCGVK